MGHLQQQQLQQRPRQQVSRPLNKQRSRATGLATPLGCSTVLGVWGLLLLARAFWLATAAAAAAPYACKQWILRGRVALWVVVLLLVLLVCLGRSRALV
jgi:hypothetical protein